MSVQQLSGSLGVMLPAFSLPRKTERRRNKERLEASLAGLRELELLKQRQECLVQSALCLGGSIIPGRLHCGGFRSARCSIGTPQGNEDSSLSVPTVS